MAEKFTASLSQPERFGATLTQPAQYSVRLGPGTPIPGPPGPEGPRGPASEYTGHVKADGTLTGLRGWTVAHPSTGEYRVVHNLQLDPAQYTVMLTSAADDLTVKEPPPVFGLLLHVANHTANDFTVWGAEGNQLTPFDAGFNFILTPALLDGEFIPGPPGPPGETGPQGPPGDPGQPRVIRDEGVALPARDVIDMVGAGVTVTDDAAGGRTVVTIPAAPVQSIFGRQGVITAQAGDYTAAQVTNAVSTAGSYADPAWITDLAWGKISGEPSVFPPSAHSHDWTDITGEPSSFPPSAHSHDWADITGEPASFPPSAHSHVAADVTGAVPDTRQIIAGAGLTGGGDLTGDVTLNVDKAAVQTPWTQHINGGGFRLDNAGQIESKSVGFKFPDGTTQVTAYSKAGAQTPWTQNVDGGGFQLSNAGSVVIQGANAGGIDVIPGLTLNRVYDAVGDSMDIVWPSTARIEVKATGGGESGVIFHAQTAAGDGTQNEVMKVLGNHQVKIPGGWLDVWRGTPTGVVSSGGPWLFTCVNYQNVSTGGGAVLATAWLGSDFTASPLTVGTVSPAYKEYFGVRGHGAVVLEATVPYDFASDAAAAAGGIPVGGIYHTAGVLKIRRT